MNCLLLKRAEKRKKIEGGVFIGPVHLMVICNVYSQRTTTLSSYHAASYMIVLWAYENFILLPYNCQTRAAQNSLKQHCHIPYKRSKVQGQMCYRHGLMPTPPR